jgi:disulfide bond formation protein DsbB
VTSLEQARALAIAVPAALLAGAYGSEIWGGLYPCEMCWWQRYPHFAALALALVSLALRGAPDRGRSFVWLAALAILTSGGIGAYHAGVEAGIFEGFTTCASTGTAGLSAEDMLKEIMASRSSAATRSNSPSSESRWRDGMRSFRSLPRCWSCG